MSTQPFVSIIINNYNYEKFLSKAISSALEQTYSNVEVIVVDDGSTDNSRSVINDYGDRIIPILQPNGKQGAAFNNGFSHSKGDIVIFLDSDDYLYPYAVEKIVSVWRPTLAKVHYRLNVVDSQGQDKGSSYPPGGKPLDQGDLASTVLEIGTYRSVPTSGNALNRRAMIPNFPIPAEFSTTSDDYLSVLIPLHGEVIAIEEPLGCYRIHDSNQWALVDLSSSRFRRFIKHDLQRCELLRQKGSALGHTVPDDLEFRSFGRVWSRLVSLRLDPQEHLVTSDNSLKLIYFGIRALWQFSDHNLAKKLLFSVWFIWVGLMPLSLAKLAINWLFMPNKRPRLLSRVFSKPATS
ncbi:glycosyltransferase [Leptothoe sp. LEGE 181152]|nr:glycosyltransferase [Leptothoe sp. LEGE 181152]